MVELFPLIGLCSVPGTRLDGVVFLGKKKKKALTPFSSTLYAQS